MPVYWPSHAAFVFLLAETFPKPRSVAAHSRRGGSVRSVVAGDVVLRQRWRSCHPPSPLQPSGARGEWVWLSVQHVSLEDIEQRRR